MITSDNIENIKIADNSTISDKKIYKGIKVKIAKVYIEEVIDYYTGPIVNGSPSFNPDSTEKKKVVVVETENLPFIENGKITDKKINVVVKERFNLKRVINKDGTIDWVISKNNKSKLWNFMKNMGVNNLKELIGQEVIITTITNDNGVWFKIMQ